MSSGMKTPGGGGGFGSPAPHVLQYVSRLTPGASAREGGADGASSSTPGQKQKHVSAFTAPYSGFTVVETMESRQRTQQEKLAALTAENHRLRNAANAHDAEMRRAAERERRERDRSGSLAEELRDWRERHAHLDLEHAQLRAAEAKLRNEAEHLGSAISQALRTGRTPISHKDSRVVQDAATTGAAVGRVTEEHAWYVAEVRRLAELAEDARHAEAVAKDRAAEMEAAILSNQPMTAYNKSLLRERTRLTKELARAKKELLREKTEKDRLKSTVKRLKKAPLCAMCGGPAASPAMVRRLMAGNVSTPKSGSAGGSSSKASSRLGSGGSGSGSGGKDVVKKKTKTGVEPTLSGRKAAGLAAAAAAAAAAAEGPVRRGGWTEEEEEDAIARAEAQRSIPARVTRRPSNLFRAIADDEGEGDAVGRDDDGFLDDGVVPRAYMWSPSAASEALGATLVGGGAFQNGPLTDRSEDAWDDGEDAEAEANEDADDSLADRAPVHAVDRLERSSPAVSSTSAVCMSSAPASPLDPSWGTETGGWSAKVDDPATATTRSAQSAQSAQTAARALFTTPYVVPTTAGGVNGDGGNASSKRSKARASVAASIQSAAAAAAAAVAARRGAGTIHEPMLTPPLRTAAGGAKRAPPSKGSKATVSSGKTVRSAASRSAAAKQKVEEATARAVEAALAALAEAQVEAVVTDAARRTPSENVGRAESATSSPEPAPVGVVRRAAPITLASAWSPGSVSTVDTPPRRRVVGSKAGDGARAMGARSARVVRVGHAASEAKGRLAMKKAAAAAAAAASPGGISVSTAASSP